MKRTMSRVGTSHVHIHVHVHLNGLDGGVGKVDVIVSGLNSGGKDFGDIDVSGSESE
jgi:hypothetical protein